jgi:hypothetical protein
MRTIGCTEVVAVVFKSKPKPQPQDIDKSLVELWRAENEVRKMEGLPPVSWEVWLSWYKWRKKQAEQGGVI